MYMGMGTEICGNFTTKATLTKGCYLFIQAGRIFNISPGFLLIKDGEIHRHRNDSHAGRSPLWSQSHRSLDKGGRAHLLGPHREAPAWVRSQRAGGKCGQELFVWFVREETGEAEYIGLGLAGVNNSSRLWVLGTVKSHLPPDPGMIRAGEQWLHQ